MMKRALASAAIVIVAGLGGSAQAASTRVFVAAQGSDSNPCTFAAPCRTFQHAHDVVAANGEIDVLDPAGYGALTITKAISIQGHGFSGISSTAGNSITVNAATTDAVFLNGLLLDGVGTGSFGIVVNSGAHIGIIDCVVRNYASDGIYVHVSQQAIVLISNVVASNNQGAGIHLAAAGSSNLRVVLDRITASDNWIYGLAVFTAPDGLIDVFVDRSVIVAGDLNSMSIQGGSTQGGTMVAMRNVDLVGHIVLTNVSFLYISNVTLAPGYQITGPSTSYVRSDGLNRAPVSGPTTQTWTAN
jgi:hypothetical protein